MNRPVIDLTLSAARFRPGDTLSGRFRILPHLPSGTTSVELSVLWLTNRKRLFGAESFGQMSVILYRVWTTEQATMTDLTDEYPFACPLPVTPWSYAGKLVSIDWLVRLRLRFESDLEEVREVGFDLTLHGR